MNADDARRGAGAYADPPATTPPADPSAAVGAAVDRADAPAPEDPRKPSSPPDLTKPSWRHVLRMTVREFQRDNATDLAAALTYFAVLALFPAVLALVSVVGLFSDAQAVVDRVMSIVDNATGDLDVQQVERVINELAQQDRAGLALITGLALALWSASGYVAAFSRAMNRIYEIDEGRPFWKLRPVLLLVTLVTVVLVAVTLAAMVLSGPVAEAIGGAIGLSDVALTVWNIAKWPVVVLLVALTIALLYWATPNVRQPKFRWISIGSFVALLVWALGTVGFALYVVNFGSYDKTYGTLAGAIVFLLWLWITNNALLFGAELDAELERARELQGGIAAEETIQLPPRDTRASSKKRAKIEQDVAAGRELRLSRGGTRGGTG